MTQVLEWIAAHVAESEAARQSGGSAKVAFRRLTREEYGNTIRDLLGVNYDATAPTPLPEEPDWQGFQRIGSVLGVSPAHIEKYLSAAEAILDEALALGPKPPQEVIRWNSCSCGLAG